MDGMNAKMDRSQSPAEPGPEIPDVKVGIALGSGAAKGWAHIGVLRALEWLGVKPCAVAGCSIGAFVGAAYAAGKLEALEEWVQQFNSWDVLGLLDPTWRRGGLIQGEKVFEAASQAIGLDAINDLPIPFTAVATDLYSGEEVWLDKGKISEVVRASCSIPGLMSPIQLGQRWLVDGAVVNPVPVSACRAMGAELVIAVDLHADGRQFRTEVVNLDTPVDPKLVPKEENDGGGFMDLLVSGRDLLGRVGELVAGKPHQPSMLAVMHQSMEILEQRHKRARLMGDPPEVFVMPRVGEIGTMEFQRANEAIVAGEAAMMRQRANIEAELERFRLARKGIM